MSGQRADFICNRRALLPVGADHGKQIFNASLGLSETLKLRTHNLKEEALLSRKRDRMVFGCVGDVGQGDWRIFGFKSGLALGRLERRSRGERRGSKEKLNSSFVSHCQASAGDRADGPAMRFFQAIDSAYVSILENVWKRIFSEERSNRPTLKRGDF